MPIGSYLSQLCAAHVYLNTFDHFVERELNVPGYLRYVGDLFLFGRSRGELRRWRSRVGEWLEGRRGLRLKHPEARVLSCRGRLDALGYRLTRQGIRARRRAYEKLERTVAREFAGGKRHHSQPDFQRSLASSIGVLMS